MEHILTLTSVTLTTVAVLLFITDLIILHLFCTAGFYGYPDTWSNPKAEHIHFIIAPIYTSLLILTTLIMIFTCLTY